MSKQRFKKKDHIFVSYAKITNYAEMYKMSAVLVKTFQET